MYIYICIYTHFYRSREKDQYRRNIDQITSKDQYRRKKEKDREIIRPWWQT